MAAVIGKAKTVRNDPPQRQHDSMTVWGYLADKDPDKFYVYVNKVNQETMWKYEADGFEVESYRKGGVRPAGITLNRAAKMLGQEIEVRGMVLMSVDKKVREAQAAAGRAEADAIQSRIRSPHIRKEVMEGINVRGQASGEPALDVVNETGPLVQ